MNLTKGQRRKINRLRRIRMRNRGECLSRFRGRISSFVVFK